jgi:hypothetical protein
MPHMDNIAPAEKDINTRGTRISQKISAEKACGPAPVKGANTTVTSDKIHII